MNKQLLFKALLLCLVFLAGCQNPVNNEPPKLFAHRGASDQFNESTLTAYKIASSEGVDALEIDLRMTSDGVLVVMHDETIDRTTDGSGSVAAFTFDELSAYPTVGNGGREEMIPRLRDLFDTFGGTEHYYIETRLVDGEAVMERPLIDLLNEYSLIEQKKVTIQSFSQKSLRQVKKLAPSVPLTRLFGKGKDNIVQASLPLYDNIGIESTDATQQSVTILQSLGKDVHVFFNDPEKEKAEQKRVEKLDVNGYFTNHISFTKKLMR
ncbi:glycerophosphodiester phosphodiesterase [Domibacillus tundrae]|uniref:glycerophosphodiester phosphodiesterase n=1 Tax=Domibacillus tundrae TaxID=1587527 RepID=UPI003394B2BB